MLTNRKHAIKVIALIKITISEDLGVLNEDTLNLACRITELI